MYRMDQKAIEALGYDKGVKAGLQQGLQQGEKEKSKEIAKRLLKNNISLEIIISCTGLTKEEIEKLK